MRVFYDRLLLQRSGDDFVVYSFFWSTALKCGVTATNTHLKLLDCVVSGASLLTGGVFECDIAHRRSVAVLCMPYKVRCSPKHHFYGALPVPYEAVRVLGSHIGMLQNHAVLHNFYFPLSVFVEQSS